MLLFFKVELWDLIRRSPVLQFTFSYGNCSFKITVPVATGGQLCHLRESYWTETVQSLQGF